MALEQKIVLVRPDPARVVHNLRGDSKSSRCNKVIVGRTRTDGRVWTLANVDMNNHWQCTHCVKAQEVAERLPVLRPQIKVLEPDKSVQIILYEASLTHAFSHTSGAVNISQCKRTWMLDDPSMQDGKMSDVTCRQCLKKLGQLMGHELSQTKRAIRERREGKDWKGMLARWEAG